MKTWFPLTSLAALACIGVLSSHLAGDDAEQGNESDRLLIEAQKICVVSGRSLDPATAIRTRAGDHTVFVCCEECLGKDVPGETWRQVLSNWKETQGECPVLGKALPSNASFVVVNGRTVFVCCRPCIARIQGDPDRYLAVVDELLSENLPEQNDE